MYLSLSLSLRLSLSLSESLSLSLSLSILLQCTVLQSLSLSFSLSLSRPLTSLSVHFVFFRKAWPRVVAVLEEREILRDHALLRPLGYAYRCFSFRL